ncbi:peptidoglycan recognition protein [Streptomyces sp. NBRC 110035]|uniref:peptidoglycan recognition protein family protein n=1 Tax=Streptomyces sp. NBRC 110035 TaxID=1547867 RepID=UPI00099C5F61
MRALTRPRGARLRRAPRIPGGAGRTGLPQAVKVLLGCLPGVAAAVALVLCAYGVERAAEPSSAAVTAREAAAHTAPRPPIVSRAAWVGDAGREQPPPRYDDEVVAVFVHHTDSPNDYDCAEAPIHIRNVYEGQTSAREWDDIGYNFVVDRCGTIYEGRAGGTDRPVTGAHTQGFNHRTTGIAALGTFTAGVPVPHAMERAIAELAAWKLGLSGTDPRSDVRLVSSNGRSRYAAGTTAMLPALAGHTDGFMTSCPGAALQARLPKIREMAAELQSRGPDAGHRQEKQQQEEAQEKAQDRAQGRNRSQSRG